MTRAPPNRADPFSSTNTLIPLLLTVLDWMSILRSGWQRTERARGQGVQGWTRPVESRSESSEAFSIQRPDSRWPPLLLHLNDTPLIRPPVSWTGVPDHFPVFEGREDETCLSVAQTFSEHWHRIKMDDWWPCLTEEKTVSHSHKWLTGCLYFSKAHLSIMTFNPVFVFFLLLMT